MIAHPEDPLDAFDRFVALLHNVKRRGNGVRATCPAHEDHTPSLDVDRGNDGNVLVICRAGCPLAAILDRLGLHLSDLFANCGDHSRSAPKPPPTRYPGVEDVGQFYQGIIGGVLTTYLYHDALGQAVGATLRFDREGTKKKIRQARVDGSEWIAEGMRAPCPLYRLPELLTADPEEPVLVFEGEKKTDRVVALGGFVATTSCGGSPAPSKTDWSPLAGRHVVIGPDNNEPGRRYRDAVANYARTAGATSVSVLELPGLAEDEDVADWIAARERDGRKREQVAAELRGLIAMAPEMPTTPVEVTEIIAPAKAGAAWPAPMADVIRVGVLGELLRIVENETEADPAAIIGDFLVRTGNAVGHGPYFEVSGDRHACNLFSCTVGETGQGRKGSSAAYPRRVFNLADADWADKCVRTGLSSGEGIIYALRDAGPSGRVDKNGEPIIEPGAEDKRCLAFEPELARTLRTSARKDNILAPILRQAWEGGVLAAITKSPYAATGAHLSIISHVTPHEFRSLLRDDDVHGGTINRFLFFASRRQRQLPFGGNVDEIALANLAVKVRTRIGAAKGYGVMLFSDAAREAWPEMYRSLQRDESTPGIGGLLLARATAQVRRVAMIFAILDGSRIVDMAHVTAAMEVWRYSRATVLYVFGTTTGNRIADRLLGELRGSPSGLDRTAMHKLFDKHVTAEDIDNALALLHTMGMANGKKIPTGGAPRQVWFPVT